MRESRRESSRESRRDSRREGLIGSKKRKDVLKTCGVLLCCVCSGCSLWWC